MICTLLLCTYYKVLPTFRMIFNLASWRWRSIWKVKQLFTLTFYFIFFEKYLKCSGCILYFIMTLINDVSPPSPLTFSNIYSLICMQIHIIKLITNNCKIILPFSGNYAINLLYTNLCSGTHKAWWNRSGHDVTLKVFL